MGKGRVKREPDSLIKMGKIARLANGKSQAAVAREIGKVPSWVNQVESGWTDPTLEPLLAYLSACGVRLEAHFD